MQEESISRNKTIVDLTNELWQMPEFKLYQDLQGLDLSIYIFHKNYVALNTMLIFLASDERADSLFTLKNQDKRSQVGRDVVFYLHNYVASAQSLVDHSRRLYEEKSKLAQQVPDYQKRKETEFALNPLARFVICLRQYCQHYEAPSIAVQTTYPNGFSARPVRKIQLALSDLLTFEKWNKEAKEYLETIETAVDIQEIVTTYRDKVMAFHQWAQTRLDEIYSSDFKRFRAKEAKILLLQLEGNIENYLSFKGNNLTTKHDIFINVLSSEDFIQLEQGSLTPQEQAQLAIKLYEKKIEIALPDEIKEKIFRLYEE